MDQQQVDLRLDSVCRFCLSAEGQLYLLFGLHKNPEVVTQNVRQLTTVELSTDDNVDYKICANCCTSLELCVKFRQTCIQATKTLEEINALNLAFNIKSLIPQPPLEIKQELPEPPTEATPPASYLDHHLLFNRDDTIDQVSLEQYGLNFVSPAALPPLLETESWPSEPSWIGFPWEQNDLTFEASFPPPPTLFHHQQAMTAVQPFMTPSGSQQQLQSFQKIVRSKYFCKICEKHFFQRNVHMQHHERYSRNCFQCLDEKLIGAYQPEAASKRHTCEICLVVKESCADFLQHAIAHHAEEHRARDSYKCDRCDKVFVLKAENSRGKVHNCVKKLRCPHCPQTFYYAKSYKKHLQFYHNVGQVEETSTRAMDGEGPTGEVKH
ncbi:uncharacterized protein LOC119767914 [Culex quinquefasciatus]|nr:uncharacterized protein LOC119767914 [Culex quinquefasciatus]